MQLARAWVDSNSHVPANETRVDLLMSLLDTAKLYDKLVCCLTVRPCCLCLRRWALVQNTDNPL